MSGNVTGDAYFIYIDGEPSSEGGTSLSSPLMVGQWARVQAAASSAVQKRGGLGFADETIYRQAASADSCTSSDTTPCTSGSYARDFFDVTQSEYGAGNGAYQPGPGWDYTSGWGALNVANFTQDVDGTTNATDGYTGTEKPAAVVSTASSTSPTGNATDPVDVSLGNEPSLDLTGATLQASASNGVTATLSGPGIGALPPADATNGSSFFVTWLDGATVYYARANESPDRELDVHLRQHGHLRPVLDVRLQRHGLERGHRERQLGHRDDHDSHPGVGGRLADGGDAADRSSGVRSARRGHAGRGTR